MSNICGQASITHTLLFFPLAYCGLKKALLQNVGVEGLGLFLDEFASPGTLMEALTTKEENQKSHSNSDTHDVFTDDSL
jgi:hypothetical protein